MSKISSKSVRALVASFCLACAAALLPVTASAQSQSLGPTVARELTKAFEIIQAAGDNAGDAEFRQALQIIEALVASRGDRMSPYEKATAYELIGSYRSQLTPPDYTAALRAFERAIALNALPENRQRQIRYFIAQLYFAEERYPEAIRFLREYIDFQNSTGANVNANTWYLLAAAYTATENFSAAQEPMERALRLHESAVAAPVPEGGTAVRRNESYYGLLNSIYSQNNVIGKRADLLEKMIGYWPANVGYWEQLSSLYSTQGRDSDAAAVLELAYKNGLLQKEVLIVALVQYYSVLDNPYRGAVLLEREMAAGNVKRSQKNLELQAQLWNLSREQKKAAAALEEAATISADGELYYRLGQIYFADEQFTKSERALTQALNRGGLKAADRGNIWLLIGNARYNIDTNSPRQRERAIEAWRNTLDTTGARQTDRRAAQGWIDYVVAVERQECNQDRVERLVIIDDYKKEKVSCESNLAIVDRSGSSFSVGLSAERIAQCRRIVASTINESSAQITYDDGTVEGTERPAFCSKY